VELLENTPVEDLPDMAAKRTLPRAILPIPTTQTARGLLRIYGRLKGELAKARSGEDVFMEPDEARAYMAHIKGLMPLLGVDFDPKAIRTVRSREQVGPLSHGGMRGGTLAVLKRNGGWMTYREIMQAHLTRSGAKLNKEEERHFLQKIREALFFLTKDGAVERELNISVGKTDELQRFRLSRKMFRPGS
jgi:hypothetical protein